MAPRRCIGPATGVRCPHIAIARRGSRCPACEATWQRARNARRTHYAGDYDRRSAELRAWAEANPEVATCWLCGHGPDPTDPWQADHVHAGDPASELRLAHRSCNARRGARQIAT